MKKTTFNLARAAKENMLTHLFLTLLLLAFAGGAKAQTAVGDGWSDDFEGTSCGWGLINGTVSNAWAWGTAVNNGGTHALYISNDGGTNNYYTLYSSAMTYATKLFSFTAGSYEFSYDWCAYGESTYDYLRVALVPATVELSAGTSTPSGFGTTSLPTGWIALDGGGKLNLVSTWQNKSVTIENVPAGNYYMVFAWCNDNSSGKNPPAAIDNVSIALEKYPKPTGLDCTLTPGNGTIATLNWTENGTATAWQICLNGDEAHLIDANSTTFGLTGLTSETAYTAKVRAVIGNETSNWSAPVTFIPTNAYSITVNDGTNTSSQVPFYSYYAYRTTKSQFIIPAASLSSITYGTLQKLTFYASVETASWGNAEWEVYVKETDAIAFSSTTLDDWSSMEKVRNAATLSISDNKMVVEFTEGYQYQGGNLMVGFLQTKTGSSTSLNWYGVSATKTALGGYDTYINQQDYLPKVTIEYSPGTVPTCPVPTDLMETDVSGSTATIGWTSTAAAWKLRYKASGGEWTTIENLTTKTYTMEGLTPNTTYYVQVQAVDGEDKSPWTRSLAFTTPFDLPYRQYFETNNIPAGWKLYSGLLSDVQTDPTNLISGNSDYHWQFSSSNGAYITFSGNDANGTKNWLVTPAVALGQASNLSFDLSLRGGYYGNGDLQTNNADDRFIVLASIDGGTSWTQLALWDNAGSERVLNNLTSTTATFKLDFPDACAGKSVKVAFYAESTESNASNRLYLDNVVFDDANRCIEPVDLTSSNVTSRTATVGWTSEGDLFNLQYKKAGDAAWTNVNGINAKTYELTGLTPKTAYTFRVQTDCGGSQSIWSEEGAFTTKFGIPFTEAFANSSRPEGWTAYSTLMSGVLDGTTTLSDYTNNGAWGFIDSSGDYYAYVNLWSGHWKQWLVTPDIIMDVENCQLTFDLRLVDSDKTGTDDQFAVLVTDDGGTTWSQLALWNNSGAARVFNNISYNGEQVALNLSAYYGKTIRLAFYAESTVYNADNVIRIDNVSVDTKPAADTHRPQNLAVSNITKNSATITWDADPAVTQWNIQYGSRKNTYRQTKNSTTNSCDLTLLSVGTEYEVLVQAVRADGNSSWSNTVFVTNFPEERCNISYTLKSKNEYGWNGTTFKVVDNTTGIEVASLTLDAGKAEEDGTLELCNGRQYNFVWIPKDYYGDCSYSFRDVNGDEFLYADAGKTGQKTSRSYTMDCTAVTCHQPKNPVADEVGFYSATVSWTPGDEDQEKWEIVCSTSYSSPSATTSGTEVTKTSYTFSNLSTNTDYYIYVRGVKGEEKSKWSRCLQIRTKNAKALPTDVEADNETFTTADIDWTVNGEETKWNLRYRVDESYTAFTVVNDITTHPYTLTGLTPNTDYEIQVQPVYDDNSTGGWSEKGYAYTLNDKAMPTDLMLDYEADNPLTAQTAKLKWTKNGAESKWNVRYREVAYFEDFENGLDDWTVYTLGESPQTAGWYAFTANDDFDAHSESLFASAWSWFNNSPYDANNWLITPQIPLQGTLKFWVLTNKDAPDSYEVLLSTTGNETTDFTTTLKALATAPTTGEWTEVSIDLSTYTGQQGYIAFHHVSNDDNYLFIDDVELCVSDWQTLESPVTATKCTLTNLTRGAGYEVQVQAVYDDNSTGDWTESYILQTIGMVPLPEDDSQSYMSNAEIIETIVALNEPVDVILGRTLKTGSYNSFAVPFAIDATTMAAKGMTAKKLTSSSIDDDGKLRLVFENATSIEAGKPYWVKVAAELENPTFEDVTVSSTVTPTITTYADLVPTFGMTLATGPVGNESDEQSVLFLGASNTLYYPSVVNDATNANSYIKGFRAYFQLKGGANARSIYMDFGDGETTGIQTLDNLTISPFGNSTISPIDNSVYDLQGRRIDGKPKSKGVYLVNGKKVIIK